MTDDISSKDTPSKDVPSKDTITREYEDLKKDFDALRGEIEHWKEAAMLERDERSRNIRNLEKFYALRSSALEVLAYLDIMADRFSDNQMLLHCRVTLRQALQDAMEGSGL